MSFVLGMTLTAILLIGCAGGGIWYWLKIKEAPKKVKQDKSPLAGNKKEPFLRSEKEKETQSVRQSPEAVKTSSSQSLEKETVQEPPVPVQAAPSSAPAKPTAPKEKSASGNNPKDYSFDETAKAIEETKKQQMQAQAAARVDTAGSALDFQQNSLPFDEVLRFEEVEKTGCPSYNPMLEVSFKIQFKNPVTGSALLNELLPLKNLQPKGNYWVYGYDSYTKSWYVPEAIGLYSSIIIFVQLASSRGVVSEVSISSVLQIKQRLEMMFDGSSDEVEQSLISNKSRNLTHLLNQFGAQISVTLRSRNEVSLDDFEKVASDLGMKRINSKLYEKVGELVQTADGKRSHDRKGAIAAAWVSPNFIVISLFVALMTPESQPLRSLMIAANAFAAPFEAEIVDNQGYPINGQILTTVKKEIDNFYQQMRDNGLEPGSPTAHKLLA